MAIGTTVTYYKNKTTINGHDVTVQQVNGPDSDVSKSEVGIWIDNIKVNPKEGCENCGIPDYFTPNDVKDLKEMKPLAAFLADNDKRICGECSQVMPIDGGRRVGFAGIQCDKCRKSKAACDGGKKHNWDCVNPHQKHNSRVPTRYACESCGQKKQSLPTG